MKQLHFTFALAVAFILAAMAPRARAQEKRELWVYCPMNILVDQQVTDMEAIWTRAAAAGYTHVLLSDNKLEKLNDLESNKTHYMANLARVKKFLADHHLQVVPAIFSIGYSEPMLWHNPNLAEGLPVKDQPFIVMNGEARPAASGNLFPAKLSFKDDSVKMDGAVATVEAGEGNARFTYALNKLPPFRCYRISVKMKTNDFHGDVRIAALVKGEHDLQYQNLGQGPTQDWKQVRVVFNTLENSDVNVYFGVWGPHKGTLQWKDWKIEEVGLLNVLRRPGTPCIVKTEAGKLLVEGTDYEPIRDSHLGNAPWKGDYENMHEPPVIKTRLADGTRLRVSWYHPAIIYDNEVAICFNEPQTLELMSDEAKRIKAAFGTAGYMMSYDEIRTCGWDQSCEAKGQTPGKMLAENLRFGTQLLDGSTAYVWSDMFDPFHNAHDNYYLVHGTWAGSWEGLGKDVVVVNWNFDDRDKSLKFFADRGNRQLIAGYYDGQLEEHTRAWLESARKVRGVVGMMYTTWQGNYSDLEKFAKLCGQ